MNNIDSAWLTEFLNESIPIWQKDPNAYFHEVLNFNPDDWQAKAADDLANYPRISIKSGQGVGKTGLEAAVALWFLTCFPFPRVVATAPTKQQLHDVLWAEIAKWMSQSPLLKELLVWSKTYVRMRGYEERWFAVARTATHPENMQGFHEENMLFIVDEASGVSDPIMEAIRGTLTGSNNKLLMCGNPTKASGTFFDSFNRDRTQFRNFTVSSADSQRTNKESIESLVNKYGWDSNVVRVRVRGLFPTQEDDVFIGISLLEQCSSKLYELPGDKRSNIVIIGCDVARYGDDETVIYLNDRGILHMVRNYRGQNLMWTAGELVSVYREFIVAEQNRENEARRNHEEYHAYSGQIYVQLDDTGLGGGVTDRLREVKKEQRLSRMAIVPINAAEKIETDTPAGKLSAQRYNDLTTDMWASLRDHLRNKDIVVEDNDVAFAQISGRKYSMASNGRLAIEPKKDMKKRGLDSPDRGDAIAMALYTGKIRKNVGSVPSDDMINDLSKQSYWRN